MLWLSYMQTAENTTGVRSGVLPERGYLRRIAGHPLSTFPLQEGGIVHIQSFRPGGDRNLGYLVADEATRAAALIDPSYDPESLLTYAESQGFEIVYVLCTHDHSDHTNGNRAVEAATGVKALLYRSTNPVTGRRVEHGEKLPLGTLEIQVLHTPGHTADSVCYLVGDALFTGDTLFVGKVGGTDLGAGARTEYESLHRVLMSLRDETRVFPGHDVGVAATSTIGRERATNPFLLREDVESFVDLKRNWAAYKKEHGIA